METVEEEMQRVRQALEKHSEYYAHDRPAYEPTQKQIEAAKLRIRKKKGEVFVNLD